MSPSPSTKHQRISGRLNTKLMIFLEGKTCEVFQAPYDIELKKEGIEDKNLVIPDLSIICNADGFTDNKSITDVGYDYGYSPSNYSSAFKKHHNISPAEFRKGKNATCVPHPFYQDKLAKFQSVEEYDEQILIQELEDLNIGSEW